MAAMISTAYSGRQSLDELEALERDISGSTNDEIGFELSGKIDDRVYKIAINITHLDRSKGKIFAGDKKIQCRLIWKSRISSRLLFKEKLTENSESFHLSFKDNPPEFYISSPYFDEVNQTLLNYQSGELLSSFQTSFGMIKYACDHLEQSIYIVVVNDKGGVYGIDPHTLLTIESMPGS